MADRADVEVPKTPSLKGVVLLSVMWFTSLVGALVLMAPLLALLPVPLDAARAAYRRWNSLVVGQWLALSALLLERAMGVRIVLTGDLVPLAADAPERAMLICNHRTRIDWMFLWCACARLGQLGALKVMLSGALVHSGLQQLPDSRPDAEEMNRILKEILPLLAMLVCCLPSCEEGNSMPCSILFILRICISVSG